MKIRLNKNILSLTLIISVGILSCRSAKEVTENPKRLNEKEAQELLFSKGNIPFWFFYSKVGIDFKGADRSNSFNATVKMRVDSAFCGTLSVGPIIGGTYLINKDSVYFTNKQDKCFVMENFSAISDLFGIDIEFAFFQSLILGLPVGLDQSIKYKYKSTREYYILSSFKKKELRKVEHDKDPVIEDDNVFVQYYLNTLTHHLDRISIQVPSDTVAVDINFVNRQPYETFFLPEQTQIKVVNPRDSLFINLDYGNVKLNERKEIDINIPESYVKCPPNN